MVEVPISPYKSDLPPVARRLRMDRMHSLHEPFNPDQMHHEHEKRAQIARKVRVMLRNLEPAVVLAPRWSQPQSFLETLASDLSTGRPALDCHTISFRRLKGRALPEVWNHLINAFRQLIPEGVSAVGPTMVVDRRGFCWSLQHLLQQAHEHAPRPLVLLACEAEHLPLAALEDLVQAWEAYATQHLFDRRCVLLLSGSVQAHWLRIGDAPRIELGDYSEQEAAAAMVAHADRGAVRRLAPIASFTGGIPGIVDRFGKYYAEYGDLPNSRAGLLQILGDLGDEMRGVVDIVAADDALAGRIERLLEGNALPERAEVDGPLRLAGLLRTTTTPLRREVSLRAPALAALLG